MLFLLLLMLSILHYFLKFIAACVDRLPLFQLLIKMLTLLLVLVVNEMFWMLLTVPESRDWHFECCCYYLLLPFTLRSECAFAANAERNNTDNWDAFISDGRPASRQYQTAKKTEIHSQTGDTMNLK